MLKKIATILVLLTSCAHLEAPKPSAIWEKDDAIRMPRPTLELEESSKIGVYAWLYLTSEVNEETVAPLINKIDSLQKEPVNSIVLEINTPGGSVEDGFLLAKKIESSKVPVICVVDNQALSMGSYILESCQIRIMTKRSLVMFHAPSVGGMFRGNPETFQTLGNALNAIWEALLEHVAYRTNISVEEFKTRTSGDRQWWMGWKECKERKVIDFVIDRVEELR